MMKKTAIVLSGLTLLSCEDEKPVRNGEIITHYDRRVAGETIRIEPAARTSIDYIIRALQGPEYLGREMTDEEKRTLYDYVNTTSGDLSTLDHVTNREVRNVNDVSREDINTYYRIITSSIRDYWHDAYLAGTYRTTEEGPLRRLIEEICNNLGREYGYSIRLLSGAERRAELDVMQESNTLQAIDTNFDKRLNKEEIQNFTRAYRSMRQAIVQMRTRGSQISIGDVFRIDILQPTRPITEEGGRTAICYFVQQYSLGREPETILREIMHRLEEPY